MIQFGIVMPTYRADHATRKRLRETIGTIKRQDYPHWKLYLIGDRYEPAEELESLIAEVPHDKLVIFNLPRAVERETLKGWELWHCGGATANNIGPTMQERDGIRYTCHLDHDDLWHTNHLSTLALAYRRFPRAGFIYTRAEYRGTNTPFLLPREATPAGYDNLPPRTVNIVHATVSWRLDLIPLRYRISRDQPADAVMWHQIREWCQLKGLPMVYIPTVTVIKQSQTADVKVQQWRAEAQAQGIYQPPK
jgi:glycosyltransferase involved in cell wall biosynthesis